MNTANNLLNNLLFILIIMCSQIFPNIKNIMFRFSHRNVFKCSGESNIFFSSLIIRHVLNKKPFIFRSVCNYTTYFLLFKYFLKRRICLFYFFFLIQIFSVIIHFIQNFLYFKKFRK